MKRVGKSRILREEEDERSEGSSILLEEDLEMEDMEEEEEGSEIEEEVEDGSEGDESEVENPNEIVAVPQKLPTKKPKYSPKPIMRRNTAPEMVRIPEISAKDEAWADALEIGTRTIPEDFYDERPVSTGMKSQNALHMIAFYCSILNTDPSYTDIWYCDPESSGERLGDLTPTMTMRTFEWYSGSA